MNLGNDLYSGNNEKRTHGSKEILALLFGILSLNCGFWFVFAPAAIILGLLSRKDNNDEISTFAWIGLICAMVSITSNVPLFFLGFMT